MYGLASSRYDLALPAAHHRQGPMPTTTSETLLFGFVEATNIRSRWDSARQLMAAKQMQAVSSQPIFHQAFRELGEACLHAEGADRLLAIDLLVRISELVRKEFTREAAEILSRVLTTEPEGTWTINESRTLPAEAKPAEIRENIAIALRQASGSWVLGYVVTALAREDRSQRCRLELCRQLATREPVVTRWLELLNGQPWFDILGGATTGIDGVSRLRDLTAALAGIIRTDRTKFSVDQTVGPSIASLVQTLARVSPREALPPRLSAAAIEVVGLLEEIFATEITLVAEPDTYAPLEVFSRWWHPLPYPEDLSAALAGTVRKLTGAITLRARMGQRSQMLVSRLTQALGAGMPTSKILLKVANSETGLVPEIDDWLRGRQRGTSGTAIAASTLLAETGAADFTRAFAPLLLDCAEGEVVAAQSSDSRIAAHVRRLKNRVDAIALDLRLSVAGAVGQLVEFNPNSHRTLDGSTPGEPQVRIIRPMVVRRRSDGSHDVIERAIVGVV